MKPVLSHMKAKVTLDEANESKAREWTLESAINAAKLQPQSDEKLARLHRAALNQPEQGVPVQDWGLRSQGVRSNGIVLDYETVKVYVDGGREMYEAMDEDKLRRLCRNNKIATCETLPATITKPERVRDLTKSELVSRLVRQSEETGQVIRPSASRAQFCEIHKRDEDRHVHLRRCSFCDDSTAPRYGDATDGIARFCANCKHAEHVDVRDKRCENQGCDSKAEYGHQVIHRCPFSMANACAGNRRWYYETKVTAQIIGHVDASWKAGHFRCEAKLKSEPKVWDATVPLRLHKEDNWMPYTLLWTAVLALFLSTIGLAWLTFMSLPQCGPETCDVFTCQTQPLLRLAGHDDASQQTDVETTSNQTALVNGTMPNRSDSSVGSVVLQSTDTDTNTTSASTTAVPSVQTGSATGIPNATDSEGICTRPNPRRAAAAVVPLTYEALDPWLCDSQYISSAYDLSSVAEELQRGQFRVDGVACSSGYQGAPVVSACSVAGEAYSITGCVAQICNTWHTLWLFVVAMYALRVVFLGVFHMRSHVTEEMMQGPGEVASKYAMLQYIQIGRINRQMFANSKASISRIVQQVSGKSQARGSGAQGLVASLWPHVRITITYMQLLSVLPVILQWDPTHYFPFVATLQNVWSKLLDPFAIFECLLPEYGSVLRIMFPICFVVLAMMWMLWDGFTVTQDDVTSRVGIERVLGIAAPMTSILSHGDFGDMFEQFLRLHRAFPEVQSTMNKFHVSKTGCGRGQAVIILDLAAWKAKQDTDETSTRPGEALLEEALEAIRNSFFNELDRAIRGDTKRAHAWGKHLGLRTVFDLDKSHAADCTPAYLITFHQLLPALRERVLKNNELLARNDDYLFMNRAERRLHVREYESSTTTRKHGLLRRDFSILTGGWALPKINTIATAMVNRDTQARERETAAEGTGTARRTSVFEMSKLQSGSETPVKDDSRLCLEVHVFQAEADETREVVYRAILRLIKDMMDPNKGLRKADRYADPDFLRWDTAWREREVTDKDWQLAQAALWDFLRSRRTTELLLRLPPGARHSACKTFRVSHWQVVAAWVSPHVHKSTRKSAVFRDVV